MSPPAALRRSSKKAVVGINVNTFLRMSVPRSSSEEGF